MDREPFVCPCGKRFKKFSRFFFHCSDDHPELEFIMNRDHKSIEMVIPELGYCYANTVHKGNQRKHIEMPECVNWMSAAEWAGE